MSDKCFCHLNGFEVKDAFSRNNIENLNKTVDDLTAKVDTALSLPEGSTTGDLELIDLRRDYNGNVHSNARASVVSQILGVKENVTPKEYTNLISNFTQVVSMSSSGEQPEITSYPFELLNGYYDNDEGKFVYNTGLKTIIFKVRSGDRLQVSGIAYSQTPSHDLFFLNSNKMVVKSYTPEETVNIVTGVTPIPENVSYVMINCGGLYTPCVTNADELISDTTPYISTSRKFISTMFSPDIAGTKLQYAGAIGESLTANVVSGTDLYCNGIYPVTPGKEYVIYLPEVIEYTGYELTFIGCLCNTDMTITDAISEEHFNGKGLYVFTAGENDSYIAINNKSNRTLFQFGENKQEYITKTCKIGNATFDGKHDISLEDIGVTPNGVVTIDNIEQNFFTKGINCVQGDDVTLIMAQQRPNKQVFLSATLTSKTDEITEETTNEIPTAKAVIDYVQSVLPPSAEGVEY